MRTTLFLVVFLLVLSPVAMANPSDADSTLPRRPAIVAHRGASFNAPENTLASVRLGWEQGSDAVEIDIWLTSDGQVVLSHDADAKRTCGIDRRIDAMTLAEVRKLDAGSWKGPQWAGEPVPTLDEVLATIPDRKRMLVEVKCGPEVVGPMLASFDRSGKTAGQTTVISFSAEVCEAVKRARPALTVYFLHSFKQDKDTDRWTPRVAEVIAKAKAIGADGVDLPAVEPVLSSEAVVAVRTAGLELHAWTVDDLAVARRLVELGFDSITTNRPGWLREELATLQ